MVEPLKAFRCQNKGIKRGLLVVRVQNELLEECITVFKEGVSRRVCYYVHVAPRSGSMKALFPTELLVLRDTEPLRPSLWM